MTDAKQNNDIYLTPVSSMVESKAVNERKMIKVNGTDISYRKTRGRTNLEKGLICLAVLLAGAVIGLIIGLVLEIKNKDETQDICLSDECTMAANRVLESMDQSADPCVDFYTYACGSWKKSHLIPEDRNLISVFEVLRDRVQLTSKNLYEDPNNCEEEETAWRTAKDMYTSCINTELIEQKNISVVIPLMNELGGWPVLGSNPGGNWNETSFDLASLLITLKKYNNDPLISLDAGSDSKNSTQHILFLDQSGFVLPGRNYYLYPRFKHMRDAYVEFASSVAVLFGADPTVARTEMEEILVFETEIANISMRREDRRDSEALYNKMTIEEMRVNLTEPKVADPIQYVGQTNRMLKTRFNEHYRRMRKPKKSDTFLYCHFRRTGHSVKDIVIQLVQTLYYDLNTSSRFGAIKRHEAEQKLMKSLQTTFPLGFNDNICHEGNVDVEIICFWNVENAELDLTVPDKMFDWFKFISGVMGLEGVEIDINETEPIVVQAVPYFKKLFNVLQKYSRRTIANYLVWTIMKNRVNNLPSRFTELRDEYNKVVYGHPRPPARWRVCEAYVTFQMRMAIGQKFVKQEFDETAKDTALEMIGNIRTEFKNILKEADWMDDQTKALAVEKAEAIRNWIGYPHDILNTSHLNELYENVTADKNEYFQNVLHNLKRYGAGAVKYLREPYSKKVWTTPPTDVNAFYNSILNNIMFPAGILQPPFYGKNQPKSMNYGGIGVVIGHEITHGFDDRGRQFNKDGDLEQWWDQTIIDKFKDKASCIVNQYDNFFVPEANMSVNGINTQGENIADNGGLKESYRAYRRWVSQQGKEEARLPGLDLSHDQLFFLSFGQVWCGNMRKEAAIGSVQTDAHSPKQFRVIGTLQNSPEFAKAYNCPSGSVMNPEKKCSVW